MTYKIINTTNGTITNCSPAKLSQNIYTNAILAEYKGGKCVRSYLITYFDVVTFAVEFADYALKNYALGAYEGSERVNEAASHCITMTRRRIQNSDAVPIEELDAAADAANAACGISMRAAYTDADVDRGIVARATADVGGGAAAAARDAAHAVAYAANAARYAADAARHAANVGGVYYTACAGDNAAYNAACARGDATPADVSARCDAYYQCPAAKSGRAAEYVRQGQFILDYLRGVCA